MTAARAVPLVTIGLPVYNGERFLPRALEALLGQTLSDFELIISDNASTDATREICERFVKADPRVRYIRQRVNIGAPRNWNVVAREARGEFFRWASASDICVPHGLESCVRVLQSDPSVVLCYGRTSFVDENEAPLELIDSDIDISDERASDRFLKVCTQLPFNNAQCGVVRLAALKRTGLDRTYPSGDMALTAELALHGKLRMLPEILVHRRKTRGTFTAMLSPLEIQRVYDPKATAPMKLICCRRQIDNLASIARSPLAFAEKLRTWKIALRLARWERRRICSELLSLVRGTQAG